MSALCAVCGLGSHDKAHHGYGGHTFISSSIAEQAVAAERRRIREAIAALPDDWWLHSTTIAYYEGSNGERPVYIGQKCVECGTIITADTTLRAQVLAIVGEE